MTTATIKHEYNEVIVQDGQAKIKHEYNEVLINGAKSTLKHFYNEIIILTESASDDPYMFFINL